MQIFHIALFIAQFSYSISARHVFYHDQYHHSVTPNKTLSAGIDHVVIAFANSSLFTTSPGGEYVPFEDIKTVRSRFDDGTKMMIAIGGWGNTAGFSQGAATDNSRKIFASNVASLCDKFGFDGVDIDWEYPGGNGDDYRQVPNSEKVSEIETFPLLLAEIRRSIGQNRYLSIATPGKIGDMIAYTPEKAPAIWQSVDWVNIMTYDLMNRRDNVTKHHTDIKASLRTVDYYINVLHLEPKKINLGFALYAKYFTVDSMKPCETGLGCATVLMEAADGTDTGKSGAVSFESSNNKMVQSHVKGFGGNLWRVMGVKNESSVNNTYSQEKLFETIMSNGITDEDAGGQYYYDRANSIFWTWDTSDLMTRKFADIIAARGLGGSMVWSLGQDSHDFNHILALQKAVAKEKTRGFSKKRYSSDQKFRGSLRNRH